MSFSSSESAGYSASYQAHPSSSELLAGAEMTAADVALCSSDEARSLLPSTEAISLNVLPLALQRSSTGLALHVAASHDSDDARQRVCFLCGIEVAITVVPAAILKDAIPRAYYGSDARLQSFLNRLSKSRGQAPLLQQPKPQGDAAQFITALLEFAAVRGASDLHLAPDEIGVVVKLRIDGQLLVLEQNPYDRFFHEQVVSRLKVLADLDISQRRLPQDGAFSFVVGEARTQVRMSTLPTSYGESVVIRFLRSQEIPRVGALGMEPLALQVLRASMNRSEGLILLTGPTGSGKTTTMYAVARELEQRGRNTVTVEDPVEARIEGSVQVQVALEQGLDYPRAIRSVLRHDPDVLLIGEMRDGVSASMGLDAASTGHLTLSSLHIGSSLDVLLRLQVLGVPLARAVPALALVVNQRLISKLCERCKKIDSTASLSSQYTFFTSVGCAACGGYGYQGRVLVTEVLNLQQRNAKEACFRASNAQELLELLPADAFMPWTHALHFHLRQGTISLSQVEEFVTSEMK